jgi:hypothetical protein
VEQVGVHSICFYRHHPDPDAEFASIEVDTENSSARLAMHFPVGSWCACPLSFKKLFKFIIMNGYDNGKNARQNIPKTWKPSNQPYRNVSQELNGNNTGLQ